MAWVYGPGLFSVVWLTLADLQQIDVNTWNVGIATATPGPHLHRLSVGNQQPAQLGTIGLVVGGHLVATGKRKPLGLWNLFSVSPDVPTSIHRSTPNAWCLDLVSLPVGVLVIKAACGKEALLLDCFPPKIGIVMEPATLTAKGQVTVPKVVRDALGLRQGD
jgi:hypothetical protein